MCDTKTSSLSLVYVLALYVLSRIGKLSFLPAYFGKLRDVHSSKKIKATFGEVAFKHPLGCNLELNYKSYIKESHDSVYRDTNTVPKDSFVICRLAIIDS